MAAETALMVVSPSIKKNEDGTFVGGDNLPVKEFVKDFITTNHAYLLKPVGGPGAGATANSGTGRGAGAGAGSKAVDIDKIKPGMSAEDRAATLSEISRVLAAQAVN